MAEHILYGREEDLSYNRAGRLSPRQVELTARPMRWLAVAIALSGVISLLIGLALPPLLNLSTSEHVILASTLGLVALAEFAGAWLAWRSARRAGEKTLEVVEGRLEHVPRASGGLPARMALGERMITVPRSDLPLRAGGRYRAYGLPVRRRSVDVLMTYTLVEINGEEEL